jgi:AcrR family transcriptional regulator
MSTDPSNRRDANAQATRALIIEKARKVFADKGFSDAWLTEIVTAAKVTTGAVYHHFGDKKGLFLAVAETVEADILKAVGRAAATKSDPWEQLMAAVQATLEICAEPGVQRIIFVDAPTVVGPAAWREIELKYAFGGMRAALQALIANGVVRSGSADVLASILLGALIEAARAVAAATDKPAAMADARETVTRLFTSLRTA